jgi:integrase/recombinase XerD
VRSKGGDTDWLHFQTGAARLLPRLIAGRTRGPLFLTDRALVGVRAPAAVDRCPETGRARLSYRCAEALFREASGGWTLHRLRHSALTHLAEQNVSLPLLMAKSRHTSLRSLQRYARPGPEAVAALTAATNPGQLHAPPAPANEASGRLDRPHPPVQLVTIAATLERDWSSPAVPSACP